jgi:hypothetical protein
LGMAAITRTVNPCGHTEALGNDRDLWEGLDGYARKISRERIRNPIQEVTHGCTKKIW